MLFSLLTLMIQTVAGNVKALILNILAVSPLDQADDTCFMSKQINPCCARP